MISKYYNLFHELQNLCIRNLKILVAFTSNGDPRYNKKVFYIPSHDYEYIKNRLREVNIEKQYEQSIEDLIHEIAHFLVAPKVRRYKKDYGIDNLLDPDTEEAKAFIVENIIRKKLKIKTIKPINTYPKNVNLSKTWIIKNSSKINKEIDNFLSTKKKT